MRYRDDLINGEKKIEAFLTHLAVHGDVAPATQNQAMNALIVLYRKVLKQDLRQEINAVRCKRKSEYTRGPDTGRNRQAFIIYDGY
jgi:hypothetical protein